MTETSHSKLWYACELIERPPDPLVMWHYGEDCCRLKAQITAQMHPEDAFLAAFVDKWWPAVKP